MRNILALTGVEFFKLRRRWQPWILLGVLLAIVSLSVFGSYMGYREMRSHPPPLPRGLEQLPEDQRQQLELARDLEYARMLRQLEKSLVLPTALASPFSVGQSVGVILLIILAASVVGGEYTSGTLRQVLARGVNRQKLLGAKLALVLACALLSLVVAFFYGTALYAVTTRLLRGGLAWDFLSLSLAGDLLALLGRTWYVLLPALLLSVALVVLARSTAVGMAVGLAYGLLEAIVVAILNQVGGWVSHIGDYSIGYNVNAIMAQNSLGDGTFRMGFNLGLVPQEANPWKAAAILAGYSLVFLAVAFLVFRRRDVTP